MPGQGDKTFFVQCVRGNTDYGINDFADNGDGTVTDGATGLMWAQDDSGDVRRPELGRGPGLGRDPNAAELPGLQRLAPAQRQGTAEHRRLHPVARTPPARRPSIRSSTPRRSPTRRARPTTPSTGAARPTPTPWAAGQRRLRGLRAVAGLHERHLGGRARRRLPAQRPQGRAIRRTTPRATGPRATPSGSTTSSGWCGTRARGGPPALPDRSPVGMDGGPAPAGPPCPMPDPAGNPGRRAVWSEKNPLITRQSGTFSDHATPVRHRLHSPGRHDPADGRRSFHTPSLAPAGRPGRHHRLPATPWPACWPARSGRRGDPRRRRPLAGRAWRSGRASTWRRASESLEDRRHRLHPGAGRIRGGARAPAAASAPCCGAVALRGGDPAAASRNRRRRAWACSASSTAWPTA